MDLKDFTLEMILEYLKNKGMLSGLEQDIFSSIQTLVKYPVDRNYLVSKINENRIKYADIWQQLSLQPGVKRVNFKDLSDDELRNNLGIQIELMWLKEAEQISHQ